MVPIQLEDAADRGRGAELAAGMVGHEDGTGSTTEKGGGGD